MCDMIGRFLKRKDCESKVFIDLKLDSDFSFNELDLKTLNNIYNSLSVVKATVLELRKRDTNLLKADVALKFMLKKLVGQANEFSNNLANFNIWSIKYNIRTTLILSSVTMTMMIPSQNLHLMKY